MPALSIPLLKHDFIFIRSDGSPANEATTRSWIRKWETFLGVPTYFHAFRHYLVTYLTRIGFSAELTTALFGWSGPSMFPLYCDLEDKDRNWKELDKLQDVLSK